MPRQVDLQHARELVKLAGACAPKWLEKEVRNFRKYREARPLHREAFLSFHEGEHVF